MTYEKQQRDAKKKQKAEEKRSLRQKRKKQTLSEPELTVEESSAKESTES